MSNLITRRNVTKAALAAGTGAALVGHEDATAQEVLADAKPLQNYAALRTYNGNATEVRITAQGIAGLFQLDPSDTTSADNGGTVIRDSSGRRWRRLFSDEVDARWFGSIDTTGSTDSSATVQTAINAMPGHAVKLPQGSLLFSVSIDAKKSRIVGQGSGNIGQPQTKIAFSGTAGFYSSTENNHGFSLEKMEIYGAGAKTATGQILVNFTGQNYPFLDDVRIWNSDIGIKLAKGINIECNYGKYFRVDVNLCRTGVSIDLTIPAATNTHHFYGGRLWDNITAVLIPSRHSNICFFGTAFEANDKYGVDSTGTNISFNGCRFENPGAINMVVRPGAGNHYFFGNHWSSGASLDDQTDSGVCYGTDLLVSSLAPLSTIAKAAISSSNLLGNGAFIYDHNEDGVPEPWIKGFSAAGTHALSLVADAACAGGRALEINNTRSSNLRVWQQIKVVKGQSYTLEWRGKTSADSWQTRVSSTSSGGTEYANVTNADTAYKRKAVRFIATSNDLYVAIFLPGNNARTVTLDYVTLTQGIVASSGVNEQAIGEHGGIAQENIGTAGGGWNTPHFTMGTYHLWVDTSGRLRIKNAAPTSDTDGSVVGVQA